MRAIRAIEQSDVCLLMIDAAEGLEGQDLNILSLIEKNHKGVVILVNKWDLAEKEQQHHPRHGSFYQIAYGAFHRHPDRFHFRIDQAAHFQSDGNGQAGL